MDHRSWSAVLRRVLESIGTGVAACDDRMNIVASTDRADELLGHFAKRVSPGQPLPGPIALAARTHLEEAEAQASGRARAVRVELPRGDSAVHVSAVRTEDLSAVTFVIWLHLEAVRDPALLGALRKRYAITPRDFQVISLLRLGHSNRQIARILGVSEGTAKNYVSRLNELTGVHSRTQLVALVEAVRQGKA